MQSNVTEITQKLLGALDSNYNVTNMAAIVEVITLLERVTITKEMLETTRLGKHINELRKHLASDALAKRAKLLVKKWRNIVLVANQPPPRSPALTNGQTLTRPLQDEGGGGGGGRKRPPSRMDIPMHGKKHRSNGGVLQAPFDYDFSDNSNSSFKDAVPAFATAGCVTGSKSSLVVVNSDSNSSTSAQEAHMRESIYDDQQPKKRGRKKGSKNHKNLIEEAESSFSNKMAVSRGNAKVKTTQELIESLQNRALPPTASTAGAPPAATPLSPARNVDDWRERAAKLTERVSMIDQKLNSGGNRHKRQQQRGGSNNNREGSAHTPTLLRGTYSSRPGTPADDDDDGGGDDDDDEEIIVVDDVPPARKQRLKASPGRVKAEPPEVGAAGGGGGSGEQGLLGPSSLSEEEALRRLPPLDASAYHPDDDSATCWCVLEEAVDVTTGTGGGGGSGGGGGGSDGGATPEAAPPPDAAFPPPLPALSFREHADCPARMRFEEKYRLNDVGGERVARLHAAHVDGMNGNYGVRLPDDDDTATSIAAPAPTNDPPGSPTTTTTQSQSSAAADDINIVPNFYQLPAKGEACSETFKKYSISEAGGGDDFGGGGGGGGGGVSDQPAIFREFHECLDRSSYDGNTLRILPYVIID